MMAMDLRDMRNPTRNLYRRRIGPQEYVALAVSNRRLIRFVDYSAGLRGFTDLDSGEQFVTEIGPLERLHVVEDRD